MSESFIGKSGLHTYSRDYFDWVWWRFAWAGGWHWSRIALADAAWRRVIFGLYWRTKVFAECGL